MKTIMSEYAENPKLDVTPKPIKLWVWYHEFDDQIVILADGDLEEMAFRFNMGLRCIGEF